MAVNVSLAEATEEKEEEEAPPLRKAPLPLPPMLPVVLPVVLPLALALPTALPSTVLPAPLLLLRSLNE